MTLCLLYASFLHVVVGFGLEQLTTPLKKLGLNLRCYATGSIQA